MFKRTTLALATTLALGLGALAWAGNPHGGPDAGSRLGRIIDLTPEQETMLAEIRAEIRTDAEDLKVSLEDNREAFRAEMQKDEPRKKVLHDLIDESAELKTSFKHTELDRMWSFYETLTPEQRAELAQAREEHPEWRPGRGGGFDHARPERERGE